MAFGAMNLASLRSQTKTEELWKDATLATSEEAEDAVFFGIYLQ